MLGITFCIVAVHRDDGDQRVIQYVKGNISTYDAEQQDSQEAEEKKTIRFLVDNLGHALLGFLFEGNPFGCSTLKTDGENGEILFGRNFDWSACDALIVQSSPENGYASISMVNRDFINQSGISVGRLPDNIQALVSLYAPLAGYYHGHSAFFPQLIRKRLTRMERWTENLINIVTGYPSAIKVLGELISDGQ